MQQAKIRGNIIESRTRGNRILGDMNLCPVTEKGGEVAAAWLTFIETCKLQKKAALEFFNDFFRSVTEGRSDYELIAQEALG